MKILIVGLNFWPELVGVGRYTGEMAAWLAAAGYEVRAVAGPPYYPSWRRERGWPRFSYRRDRMSASGQYEGTVARVVEIFRCPIYVPHVQTGFRRLLHVMSFAASSLPVLLRQLAWRPQVVMVIAPTLACAPGALLAARICAAPAWLHVQDFELDAAYELRMLRSTRLNKIAAACERWLTQRFQSASTLSPAMAERLAQKGLARERILLLPNWVDTATIVPLRGSSPLRGELGIRGGRLVALYSGALGTKQGLERVVDAARILAMLPLDIVICGDGPARAVLQERSRGYDNIQFIPLQPEARLNELLNLADIHLLPQRSGVSDMVMPSKLGGMLASGRPVIAMADSGTEVARLVEGCGLVVPPEDSESLARAIGELCRNPQLRALLGAAARARAESELGRDRILGELERRIAAIAGS